MVDLDSSFAALLSRLRLAAAMTQEDLCEATGLSVQAVSALESGKRRAPQAWTVEALLKALRPSPVDRAEFVAAAERARRRGPRNGSNTAATKSRSRIFDLPADLAPFIGRRAEIEEIQRLLNRSRLLTLVGAGGIGKSRVAVQFARGQLDAWPDGIYFVDLAPLEYEQALPVAILSAFGRSASVNADPATVVERILQSRRLLLILDNCEHLAEGVAATAERLLSNCHDVKILATSRHVLGVTAECIYRVPPLSLPAGDVHPMTLQQIRGFDATALFLSLIETTHPETVFANEDASVILDICRRLDGLALAIKLAAARVPMLGLRVVQGRLDQRLHLLTRGVAGTRQQTLRALIDWSHDLLSDKERTLFRRLGIFVDGWTLDAAEMVCSGDDVQETEILDLLSSLVEKSLVETRTNPSALSESAKSLCIEGTTRYRLLESVKAYAFERLSLGAEDVSFAGRHATWVASLADAAYRRFWTSPIRDWLKAVLPDVENVRSALAWSLQPGNDPTLAGRIVSGLVPLWQARGLGEGRRWIEAVLEQIDSLDSEAVRARLWWAEAALTVAKQKAEAASRAAALYRAAGDSSGLAEALRAEAEGLRHMHHLAEAEDRIAEAISNLQRADLQTTLRYAAALQTRALVLLDQGRHDEALVVLTESLERFERAGDTASAASVAVQLAELHYRAGDLVRSIKLVEDAVQNAGRSADRAGALCNAAAYLLTAGRMPEAREAARQALELATQEELGIYATIAIQHLATVGLHSGDAARAASLIAFVDDWYRKEGFQREATEAKTYDMAMQTMKHRFNTDELRTFAKRGAGLDQRTAAIEALVLG